MIERLLDGLSTQSVSSLPSYIYVYPLRKDIWNWREKFRPWVKSLTVYCFGCDPSTGREPWSGRNIAVVNREGSFVATTRRDVTDQGPSLRWFVLSAVLQMVRRHFSKGESTLNICLSLDQTTLRRSDLQHRCLERHDSTVVYTGDSNLNSRGSRRWEQKKTT